MPSIPVPSDFDRTTLRREVNAEVQRFVSTTASSVPGGGKEVNKKFRAMWAAITGLAGQPTTLHAINTRNRRFQVGEVAAVCFLGSQEVILLRIFYRTGEDTWQEYEYAYCERRGTRQWTEAREFYRSLAAQQTDKAPPIDIDMAIVRSTAEELLARITSGGRTFRPKGKTLTGVLVEEQIKGLRPLFELGVDDARTAPVSSHRVICFISEAVGLSLRVYRYTPDGWRYATFTLDVSYSRPSGQRRGRRGGDVQYRWQ